MYVCHRRQLNQYPHMPVVDMNDEDIVGIIISCPRSLLRITTPLRRQEAVYWWARAVFSQNRDYKRDVRTSSNELVLTFTNKWPVPIVLVIWQFEILVGVVVRLYFKRSSPSAGFTVAYCAHLLRAWNIFYEWHMSPFGSIWASIRLQYKAERVDSPLWFEIEAVWSIQWRHLKQMICHRLRRWD